MSYPRPIDAELASLGWQALQSADGQYEVYSHEGVLLGSVIESPIRHCGTWLGGYMRRPTECRVVVNNTPIRAGVDYKWWVTDISNTLTLVADGVLTPTDIVKRLPEGW